jgi:RES domain-containing protein
MVQGGRLKAALGRAALIAVRGPWFRMVAHRHLLTAPAGRRGKPQPLWAGASKINGARFTPKGSFDSLYLAFDPVTALLEVQALVLLPGATVPLRTAPWTLVSVDGSVGHVLDLTDAKILDALGTNESEIGGPWVKVTDPPTQELAKAAYDSRRISGIKYGSAKNPGGFNLVVFTDRLGISSIEHLEVYDPDGHLHQRIGA